MKLGTGCTMIEVSQALGYYANPLMLSRMVNHPNLNKWSRVKPVPYTGPSYDNVSDLEAFMDLNGWGIEMDSVGVLNTDELMYGSALTLSKGECWHYSGFTPSQSYPARLGDFRHYNTDAECPYLPVELSYYDPGIEGHEGPTIELSWSKNFSPNVEIDPYLKDTLHGKYYIVYRKKGELTANSAATAIVSATTNGMSSGWLELNSAQTGDYEACALIKRGGGDGELYPLPETYLSFNLRNMSETEYAGIDVYNLCSLTRRSAGGSTGDLIVHFRVRNLTNEAFTIKTRCAVYDSKSSPNTNYLFPYPIEDYEINVPAGGSVDVWGNDNNQLSTTQQEAIKIEGINDLTLPITASCYAKNTIRPKITLTRTATILDS